MAFNPFKNFRKHQKFWMPMVLLLCMITFVLCTGVGGDLSDRIIALFSNRRGPAVGKLYGHNVYLKDMQDLRLRRNIADLFMRNASREAINLLAAQVQHVNKNVPESKRGDFVLKANNMRMDLRKRLDEKPRYFSGGVKFEDLLNFKLWLHEADRLGITLERDGVAYLVNQAIYAAYCGFDENASRKVQYEVYRTYPNQANDEVISAALRDEFRVQIAQLALMEARPDLVIHNPNNPLRNISEPPQIRRPLAPEQVWEDYRKKCASFDVTLVPVPVGDFLKQVPAPTEPQLQDLYERHRNNDFNPTLDRPSFKFPARMKVQWVSADPESKHYRTFARAVTILESIPGIGGNVGIQMIAPLGALRFASQVMAWDASLQRNYEMIRDNNREAYAAPSLTAPNFLLELANRLDKSSPTTVAALVGSAARPGLAFAAPLAYETDIYFRHQKELARVLPALVQPRAPLAASLVLAGAASQVMPFCLLNCAQERSDFLWQVQYLPLDLVREELRDKLELKLAQDWIVENRVMPKVRDQLSKQGTAGKQDAFEIFLPKLVKQYGLTEGQTDRFYNRYDIAKAPALQPLLKSFDKHRQQINITEGRAGKPEMLKEDDFWRLFFDSSIGFSVENAGLYVAKPWPPNVKVKRTDLGSANPDEAQIVPLFEKSGHPFLFWQTAFEPAREPKSLDEVRDKVVAAYKEIEARDKLALPRAKQIALALQRAGKDLRPLLTEEAAKLGHDPLMLRGVAPLVAAPAPRGEPRTYGLYELPKDLFVYPREDTVKELLALNDLTVDSKTAIKTGNKELDDLNEELLKRKVPGKQIQILSNKPRTIFFVAAITSSPEPSQAQFVSEVFTAGGYNLDGFIEHSQVEAGKAYQVALVDQLRKEAEIEVHREYQSSFDGGGD